MWTLSKEVPGMNKNRLTGLSDKMSDFILVTMCAIVMLVVAYPL